MIARFTGADGPVCLAPSSSRPDPDNPFLMNVTVHPAAISRSSVLSRLAEDGGELRLPSSITMSEFNAWNASNSIEPIECRGFYFSDLCALLKVTIFHSGQYHVSWQSA